MNKVMGQDVGLNNTFIEGNPLMGQEGTEITASWLNSVQEEITGIPFVLEGAAPTSDNNQAGKAIKRALANAIANLDSKSISALANAITNLDNKSTTARASLEERTTSAITNLDNKSTTALTNAITNLDNKSTTALTTAKAEAAKQWCSDYAGNLDAITKPGIYRADTGATSLPAGATVGNFYVLHIQDPDHPSAPLVQQGWSHQASTPLQTWTRSKVSGGSWGAWVRSQEAFGAYLSDMDNAPSSGLYNYAGSYMALVHKVNSLNEYQLILQNENFYTRRKYNGSWSGGGQYNDWRKIGAASEIFSGNTYLPLPALYETRVMAAHSIVNLYLPSQGTYRYVKVNGHQNYGAADMYGTSYESGGTRMQHGDGSDDTTLIVYTRLS